MINILLLVGIVQVASAVDVGRATKYVRTEKMEHAAVSPHGDVEGHSMAYPSSFLETDAYVYQSSAPSADAASVCADEDNGWPVQCITNGTETALMECSSAASYCDRMTRITQTQYAMYMNCLRDVCACLRVGDVGNAQNKVALPDACELVGGWHTLALNHLQKSMDRQVNGTAGSPLPFNMAATQPSFSWDNTLPTALSGTEKSCAYFGNGHLFSFDRLVDPNIVTEFAMQSNYKWVNNGQYWLVRDPERTVSIQAQLCYAFNYDAKTKLATTCQSDFSHLDASGSIRSIVVAGRFMKGHHLRIDALYGEVMFDGYPLDGLGADGTSFVSGINAHQAWHWKWPANCQENTNGANGCLVYIREDAGLDGSTSLVRSDTTDLIMEVALPLGITLTLHRDSYKMNAIVRMQSLGGQDGLCGNFDNDVISEFGTAGMTGGDNFVVAASDSAWGLPKVNVGQCCSDSTCALGDGTNTPFSCVPLEGMVAWYQSSSLTPTSWQSAVGGFTGAATAGSAVKANDGNYLQSGDNKAEYNFGNILPEVFTICTISRYNTKVTSLQTGTNLFEGTNAGVSSNSSLYWAGMGGYVPTAYFGGWVVNTSHFSNSNANQVIYGHHATNVPGLDPSDWYAACGTNTAPYVMHWQPDPKNLAGPQIMNNWWKPSVQPTGRGGNQALYLRAGGLWAVAEVITYNRALSPFELNMTLAYFQKVASQLPKCLSTSDGTVEVCNGACSHTSAIVTSSTPPSCR